MLREIVIKPRRGIDIREVFEHLELLFFLVWKDIKVKYKRAFIGFGWAIIQPFMTMIVFTIFFGKLANLPAQGLPYPIFYYSGLLPWTYFSSSFQSAVNSILAYRGIITKVYFPRIILPLQAVISPLFDFLVAFAMFLVLAIIYKIKFTVYFLLFPVFVFLLLLFSLSLGLWLSVLNALFQDIKYVLPFFVNFLLFLSPVAYSSELVPEKWRWIYGLNPLAGIIEGFRWSITGAGNPPQNVLLVSFFVLLIVFIGGIIFFSKMEKDFVDII